MKLAYAILALLLFAGNSAFAADNLKRMEWKVDGIAREALVYSPSTAKTDPSPVVFAYLRQLAPALYEEECRRVQSRFDDAVRLAEEAFTGELAKLVNHLTERLAGAEDGKPKIFRDSAIENLTEFFQRYQSLNVRSSDQLDRLVADAQNVIRGVEPQALRDDAGLRQQVATDMSRVQAALDGLLVDRPRRNILRRPR